MAVNDNVPVILIVDDDEFFVEVLGRALEKRGYQVASASDVSSAIEVTENVTPSYAVVDLSMPGASGLVLVEHLSRNSPDTRTIVLTGYASISTAVEAIKLGATHYLTKPADADEILVALHREDGNSAVNVEPRPMSVNRVEWEHIQKVLTECGGNISEAARKLNMHRRTLQRKLQKRPVRV